MRSRSLIILILSSCDVVSMLVGHSVLISWISLFAPQCIILRYSVLL